MADWEKMTDAERKAEWESARNDANKAEWEMARRDAHDREHNVMEIGPLEWIGLIAILGVVIGLMSCF